EGSSAKRSTTIRTARSLNSCEYLLGMFLSSQKQVGTKPRTLQYGFVGEGGEPVGLGEFGGEEYVVVFPVIGGVQTNTERIFTD
ncbi:hypothetical protein, partial [Mobiluncus porci]|uniref:hypothetical protein n=1 Tax=Mobiluncus porci TaxID=2652278 RepID=UPI001E2CFDCE